MGIFAELVMQKAESKKLSPVEWLRVNLENLPRYHIVTHVGKYTNPDVNVALCDESKSKCNGYVTTASVNAANDIFMGGAQYMGLASILVKKMENGRTVLQHFEDDTKEIRDDVMQVGADYEALRKEILQIGRPQLPDTSDGRLRQVYFPVGGDEGYHLLSILPSSANMRALTDVLIEQNERRMECRNKKNKAYGEDYDDIPYLTKMTFGAGQPQNISCFNEKRGMYMLLSVPPLPPKKRLRIPKQNFFSEVIWPTLYKTKYEKLDHLFKDDRNNKKIRDAITMHAEDIAYDIVFRAGRIREVGKGWSGDTKLSESQRIWLDDAFQERRMHEIEWIDSISESFGRWFVNGYEKVAEKSVTLSDTEMKYFARLMRGILKEEVQSSR